MLRAAHSTCSNVSQLSCTLRSAAHEHLALSILGNRSLPPPGWESPAFVWNPHDSVCLKHIPEDDHNQINTIIS